MCLVKRKVLLLFRYYFCCSLDSVCTVFTMISEARYSLDKPEWKRALL